MKAIYIVFIISFLWRPLQAQSPQVPILVPEVINVYPHDSSAFTQGLLWDNGFLYESTGLWGESTLRRVDIASGEPARVLALDDDYFAEGLERVGDQLIQLTWQAGIASFTTSLHLSCSTHLLTKVRAGDCAMTNTSSS